jgi:hypothetical protein
MGMFLDYFFAFGFDFTRAFGLASSSPVSARD